MSEIIPNTENTHVAALAVAWEIVRIAYSPNKTGERKSNEEELKEFTNAVLKVYQAINHITPIE